MAKIFRKTQAAILVSKDVNLLSKASASKTVSPLSFENWHRCNVYNKQLNKSSELAKRIFSSAFWCDHHLVIETLYGRWILWMPLPSCTFSRTSLLGLLDLEECRTVSAFDFLCLMTENWTRKMKKIRLTNLLLFWKRGENDEIFRQHFNWGSSIGHDTTGFDVAKCYF